MDIDNVTILLIRFLRNPKYGNQSRFGYDFYVPNLLRHYLERNGIRSHEQDQKLSEYMPAFYAAAWELCRRGVIRPGVSQFGAQSTDEGNAGDGYSLTPFGKRWLEESEKDDFVPTEPGRFAEMFNPYKPLFGSGFYERAQEAIRCYGAHAYLACCAMCGAAAESIVLSAAIAKDKEEKILKIYASAGGRHHIENLLVGKTRKQLQNEYRGYSSLLKYWRDEAAHGHASKIKDNEAFTSLSLLLRFAAFVNDNWDELTGSS